MSVLKIGIPVVLQSLISIGVNMTDTMMVGALGEVPLSGASLANDYTSLFMILCFGVGGGASVLTAQYWGARDIPALKKVVNIMLWIILSISLVFLLVTAIAPGWIMSIYTPDQEIIASGTDYLHILAATFPMMGIVLTLTSVLRSVRQVRVPLIATIIAFIANIFGDWVFIFGKFGLPAMGIRGAALSTLIVRVFEVCVVGGYFFFIDKNIGYRIKDFFSKVSRSQFALYIKYSVPVIVSDTFMAFGNTAISMIMGRIGGSFVAANAIISNVVRLATIFNNGVSNASGIITGNTLGTGDREKAYQQGKTFLALAVIIGVFAALVILIASPIMVSFFDLQEETVAIANQLTLAVAVMVIFQTMESVLTKGVLRGGGDTRFLMVADVLFLWLASIPLGVLTGLVLHLPAFWIYASLRVDAVIKAIWCIFRLRSRKWMRVVSVQKAEEDSPQAAVES